MKLKRKRVNYRAWALVTRAHGFPCYARGPTLAIARTRELLRKWRKECLPWVTTQTRLVRVEIKEIIR